MPKVQVNLKGNNLLPAERRISWLFQAENFHNFCKNFIKFLSWPSKLNSEFKLDPSHVTLEMVGSTFGFTFGTVHSLTDALIKTTFCWQTKFFIPQKFLMNTIMKRDSKMGRYIFHETVYLPYKTSRKLVTIKDQQITKQQSI